MRGVTSGMRIFSTKNTVSAAAAVALLVAGSATAQTASTGVDAYVGLADAMGVECSDVHFGVWRVEQSLATGTSSVDVIELVGENAAGTVTSDVNFLNNGDDFLAVSAATGIDAPAVGECDVTGANTGQSTTSIKFVDPTDSSEVAGDTGVSFDFTAVADASAYAFGPLGAPQTAASIKGKLVSYTSDKTTPASTFAIDTATGDSTIEKGRGFLIGGTVAMEPGNITDNSLGGYVSDNPVEVVVSVTN
ncbi:hypothetical protein [Spiribacter roseus]|uniref:hypothetical protein n=1 Tax=Spiribacter roseus TaxID=1855875 RepID=UPI00132F6F79|nr:hypothetical protein [Spiribacter roseus]